MKILLVKDDVLTVATQTNTLTAAGYLLDTTNDGYAALELVRTYQYDRLVSDVAIAGLDGISVCHQLRHEGYRLPTATSSSHDCAIELEAGVDDYKSQPNDKCLLVSFAWLSLISII